MSRRKSSTISLIQSAPQPSLDDVNLSHMLNGETCSPIAFNDFLGFVTRKELSSENLLFVVWFRSYMTRFNALPTEQRLGVPVPSTKLGDRYRPFAHLNAAAVSTLDKHNPQDGGGDGGKLRLDPGAEESRLEVTMVQLPHQGSESTFVPCEWSKNEGCRCGNHSSTGGFFSRRKHTDSAAPSEASTPLSNLPPGTAHLKVDQQPMREEAMRAFSTFLRKGGSRELGISDDLREFAKACLKRTTAPQAVSPIS